jgi:transposase-like protein
MNNVIEQDHRFMKMRIVASQWLHSVEGALNAKKVAVSRTEVTS